MTTRYPHKTLDTDLKFHISTFHNATIPHKNGNVLFFAQNKKQSSNSHCNVDVRKVLTCREFLWVYLCQTNDNFQEAESQEIEKMLQTTAILQLILFIRSKEEL